MKVPPLPLNLERAAAWTWRLLIGTAALALVLGLLWYLRVIVLPGNGHVHVSGELEVAGTGVPVAFDASVRVIDGELEATTTVDQGRFGMSRGRFATSGRRRSCM